MSAAIGARQGWLNADPQRSQQGVASSDFDEFCRPEARIVRYDLLWSCYQNNTFWQGLHPWAALLKQRFGLYRHTRQIFNPTHRLGEFWATHLVGGTLDKDAGDGSEVKSAIPIETTNEAIRPAIAQLWRDSRWGIKKDDWARKGAVLGDVGLLACDDIDRGRVSLKVIHPGHVKWMERDESGRILGYTLQETRYDPRLKIRQLNPTVNPQSLRMSVTYNEEAWTEGGKLYRRTYLNGSLFDWRIAPDGQPFGTRPGSEPEWEAPYGFIPLVMSQHLDVGLDFGMSEPHALLSKVFEVDDVASNGNDQIRKILNAPWAITGCNPPLNGTVPTPDGATPNQGNPQPSRTETNLFYFPSPDTKLTPMVGNMPLEAVGLQVDRINAEIEKEYPELRFYMMNEVGDTSGRALRVARQATESKVQARRTGYDEGLALVQKMALTIGSIRGYEGYAGLGADSPDAPSIDHSIAHRPVFAPDPLDDIEEGNAFWMMVGAAVTAGMPLELILEREGWPSEDIAKVTRAKEEAAQKALENAQAMAKTQPNFPPARAEK